MRELALHILDLAENSLRAGATVFELTIEVDAGFDRLRILVDDNGPGLDVPPEHALDPFYTTKQGKRTGLGLSLVRGAAERAGGRLVLERSPLGGLRVILEMGLKHVDRSPLGDLTGTLAGLVCTNPHVDFRICLSIGGEPCELSTFALAREHHLGPENSLALARRFSEALAVGLARCGDLLQ